MKTPQISVPKLAHALGIANELWLKREDKHHYGSHKGRSIPLMMSEARKEGARSFVISSSGNAAIAAIEAVAASNKNNPQEPVRLTIFVGEKIDPTKWETIKQKSQGNESIQISQVKNPKQTAFQAAKVGATWLRQSTSEIALLGYEELATELAKIPELAAIFIPTSSGTTALGLYQGCQKLKINPQIHIIQTSTCHPIVQEINGQDKMNERNGNEKPTEISLASAIVDHVALRKKEVAEAVKKSNGSGWIASNDAIRSAQKIVHEAIGVDLSPNSALSIVGLIEAQKNQCLPKGALVCLVTGP